MKKNGLWLSLLVLCILFAWNSRGEQEVLHMGCNAVVLAVDLETETVTVRDPDGESLFGDSCILIAQKSLEVVYYDHETEVLMVIGLEDLQPGDAITVDAYESQLEKIHTGKIQIQQIQLKTQRKSTA